MPDITMPGIAGVTIVKPHATGRTIVIEANDYGTTVTRRAVITQTVLTVLVRALNDDDSVSRAREFHHLVRLLEDTYRFQHRDK